MGYFEWPEGGLVIVAGDKYNKCARLVQVPPNDIGIYKHESELNELELKALKNDGYIKKCVKISRERNNLK